MLLWYIAIWSLYVLYFDRWFSSVQLIDCLVTDQVSLPAIANLKVVNCCQLTGTSQPQPETETVFVVVSEASHWAARFR